MHQCTWERIIVYKLSEHFTEIVACDYTCTYDAINLYRSSLPKFLLASRLMSISTSSKSPAHPNDLGWWNNFNDIIKMKTLPGGQAICYYYYMSCSGKRDHIYIYYVENVELVLRVESYTFKCKCTL